jgi:iron complex outermembrane receptor protein
MAEPVRPPSSARRLRALFSPDPGSTATGKTCTDPDRCRALRGPARARRPSPGRRARWAGLGLLAACAAAVAEDTVVISGKTGADASVAGFGPQAVARSPFQASAFGATTLADNGVQGLAGLTRLSANTSDAYNAEGYWPGLSVRGFALDNRFNYRRDELPINAETAIALDNKERVELLAGTSGLQAGTSAPGGLVDLVVKRPTLSLQQARLAWRGAGSVLAAMDWSQRLGSSQQFGLRVNAAAEQLDPMVRDSRGRRQLLAAAVDLHLPEGGLLEAEVEHSRQRQPSVAGFSLLGDEVPDAGRIDRRLNLNRQPWSGPVEMRSRTASLRWQQPLSGTLRLHVHAMQQQLDSDDRTAFPYGVYGTDYGCPLWCDRFAPDGSFSYWEYLSLDERRRSRALDIGVRGQARLGAGGPLVHGTLGVLRSSYRARLQDQVFDLAGTGRIDGSLDTPASPGYTDANTQRDEHSTEPYVRGQVALTPGMTLWAGLRHVRLDRASERTSPADDGLRATRYRQHAASPWLALSVDLGRQTMAYASWGRGLESDVAPNRSRYTNAGQALPALASRQFEAGIRHDQAEVPWSLALFDIQRPQSADIGDCDVARSCTRQPDGHARHRGAEAQLGLRHGAWHWQGSAMWLRARRTGSVTPGIEGTRPVNVPATSLRSSLTWRAPRHTALELTGSLVAEGDRLIVPGDRNLRLPGWVRSDLALRWQVPQGSAIWTWRAGVDNVFDRKAWKESPYQFGHVYLYPLAVRTWRASVDVVY